MYASSLIPVLNDNHDDGMPHGGFECACTIDTGKELTSVHFTGVERQLKLNWTMVECMRE